MTHLGMYICRVCGKPEYPQNPHPDCTGKAMQEFLSSIQQRREELREDKTMTNPTFTMLGQVYTIDLENNAVLCNGEVHPELSKWVEHLHTAWCAGALHESTK